MGFLQSLLEKHWLSILIALGIVVVAILASIRIRTGRDVNISKRGIKNFNVRGNENIVGSYNVKIKGDGDHKINKK